MVGSVSTHKNTTKEYAVKISIANFMPSFFINFIISQKVVEPRLFLPDIQLMSILLHEPHHQCFLSM